MKSKFLTKFYNDPFLLKNSVEKESNRMDYWLSLKLFNDAVTTT
jgi:hypothetical protein